MTLRAIATDIFHRMLAAIEVGAVVRQALRLDGDQLTAGNTVVDLRQFSRVVVVAVGKASVPMAQAAANLLGERLHAGLVATNEVDSVAPDSFLHFVGGHPLPNQGSIDAAQAALQLLREANDEQTLVVFLLSGGGSALFETPIDSSLTLEDLQSINRVLVGCGAVIGEMNVVRRFLSAVKGGRLAEAAAKAKAAMQQAGEAAVQAAEKTGEAAKAVAEAAKETGKEAYTATKDAAKEVGSATVQAAKEVGSATADAAKDAGEAAKK